ncbi:uncharacterized protein LOC123523809 isoform X2 [Mercenaria mercenaria]|uniref:uncharacterized protein LOC123523809 isoform X2 n=1 Tax=Mercenaria mercenaria TaxID=6596 RepID=UPI00234EB65B|nr:uncharacterized protein LOC123523809 isoform X2 [Mercenaria mercenaria]
MTMNIGPDSVLVGFTSSLAGVIILLVFTLIIWFIRRVILKGKRYGNLQMSTRDTSAPIYDEIPDNDDTKELNCLSGSHLYMEVVTAHTARSIHESGPNTHNSSYTEVAGDWAAALAVEETIIDHPLVCANALGMSALHSEASNYNKSNEIHTSSFISLHNAEVYGKSSNLSRTYYEIPDMIPDHDHNTEIERNDTNDGYEIPISGTSSTAQNAEAGEASVSEQCNRMTDLVTSPTRDSKVTQIKDVISTRIKQTDVNDINQTLQMAKEDKRNSSSSGLDTDILLETHQTQETVTEGDDDSLNYIHPVN